MWGLFVSAAIEEGVSFLGMSMEVNNHFDLFLIGDVDDMILDVVDLRIQLLSGSFPPSIEISANE